MRFLLYLAMLSGLINSSYAASRMITEVSIPTTLSFIPQIVQEHPIISLIIVATVISYLILRIRKFLRDK